MYLIEYVIKYLRNKKRKPVEDFEDPNYEKCDHIYLPLDTAGIQLACTKCGHIIKNPNRNPFS